MRYSSLLLVVLLSASCHSKKVYNYSQRIVIKVEGATTGSVNQVVALTVHWQFTSGSCDVFDKFEESRQGNTIKIKVYGHWTENVCTSDVGINKVTYNFSSSTPGTFELLFENMDGSVVIHTITIS